MSIPTGIARLVLQEGADWVAVIGIPLSAPLGAQQVIVRGTDGRREIAFSVGDKHYAPSPSKWRRRQVDLSPADLARVNRRTSTHRTRIETNGV